MNKINDETRCIACGCFMKEIDCSTESGWDYSFICNNPKCKGNGCDRGKKDGWCHAVNGKHCKSYLDTGTKDGGGCELAL